jgi:hypothetical protein
VESIKELGLPLKIFTIFCYVPVSLDKAIFLSIPFNCAPAINVKQNSRVVNKHL